MDDKLLMSSTLPEKGIPDWVLNTGGGVSFKLGNILYICIAITNINYSTHRVFYSDEIVIKILLLPRYRVQESLFIVNPTVDLFNDCSN